MHWFRFYSEFATDAKVQSMPEAMQRRLVMLFCLHASGELAGLDDDTLAFALRISPDELAETKQLFTRKGFITGKWTLRNWAKRQYKSDSSAERVRRYRASRKRPCNGDVTLQDRHGNGDVTPSHVRAPAGDHAGARPRSDSDTDSDTDTDSEYTPPNPPDGGDGVCVSGGVNEQVDSTRPTPETEAVADFADKLDPMGSWGPWVRRMAVMYDPSWIRTAIEHAAGRNTLSQGFVYGILKRYASQGGPDQQPAHRARDPGPRRLTYAERQAELGRKILETDLSFLPEG